MNKRKKKSLLRKMRKLVESTHWIKGAYHQKGKNNKHEYCLVGMANKMEGMKRTSIGYGPYTDRPIMMATAKAIAKEYPRSSFGKKFRRWEKGDSVYPPQIENWNDAHQTTRERVLKVLDRAIEDVE